MSELRDWQLSAAEQQQNFYQKFGDREWDSIRQTDTNTLNTKISFTFFSKSYETCTTEEKNTISATKEKLQKLCGSGDIHFGCVFVCVRPKDTKNEHGIVPLIRVRSTYGSKVYFMEKQPGRVYTGWKDFMEDNKLREGTMCYPKDGVYKKSSNTNRVDVKFGELSGKSLVGIILDFASGGANVAASLVIAASAFFPLALPVVVGAFAVGATATGYSVTRKAVDLVDRHTHEESISLSDKQAKYTWIGMGLDIVGLGTMGPAAILPRLVASGRLPISMAGLVMEALNVVSVGMNGFGVVANITILIIKLIEGKLELADMKYLIGCCLFFRNIVLNVTIAEKVIQYMSKVPSQLNKIFNMTSNTSFSTVKAISVATNLKAVIGAICGIWEIPFLRHFTANRCEQVLQGVLCQLRQFRRWLIETSYLCMNLVELLNGFLKEFLDEICEAWTKIQKFFVNRELPGNMFRGPSVEAAAIVNTGERILDEADMDGGSVREFAFDEMIRAAVEMVKKTNAQTEREFSNACQKILNKIGQCYERRIIVKGAGSNLSSTDRLRVFREAISECRNEFVNHANLSENIENPVPLDNLPLVPLTESDDVDFFSFQVPTNELDQFKCDAASHFLRGDDYLQHGSTESCDGSFDLIRYNSFTLIFYYKPLPDSDSTIGFVFFRN